MKNYTLWDYTLWIDNSLDSEKAIDLLNKKSIEFKLINIPLDGGWQLPALFIPDGRLEGLECITSYIETAYPTA